MMLSNQSESECVQNRHQDIGHGHTRRVKERSVHLLIQVVVEIVQGAGCFYKLQINSRLCPTLNKHFKLLTAITLWLL